MTRTDIASPNRTALNRAQEVDRVACVPVSAITVRASVC